MSRLSAFTLALFALVSALEARAVGPGVSLPAVKPVIACEALATTDLQGAADTPASVSSAGVIRTPKGDFCKVITRVAPNIVIGTYLPVARWTQRYYQAAGPAAGPNGFPYAGTCQPALNGEFVYAGSNQRYTMVVGNRDTPGWKPDAQRRLDYAYRASHVTALVSKLLIRTYYGRPQRYAYFIGCSEGGREALEEAERFPDDFDGIGAGSPGLLATAQEAAFHLWKADANRRADGSNILLPDRLQLLHAAVLAHCDTLSGVKDGLLQDPSACTFRPDAMRCLPEATNTTSCFTAEEVAAIDRLYDGARDRDGTSIYWGLQPGSELDWGLPKTRDEPNRAGAVHALQLAYILLPEPHPEFLNPDRVPIGSAAFAAATALSPLWDAGDTDLARFAKHGGKLVLWHGLSDTSIPVEATIAYYRGVQRTMGANRVDGFVRAFLPPGVGHCGGGDGYDQIDILSALMGWVEAQRPPASIVTGRRAGNAAPSISPGDPLADTIAPYATPWPSLSARRPVYPFPAIARYSGAGDPADAAAYFPLARPDSFRPTRRYLAERLIGPELNRDYKVVDGKLVEASR